MSILLTNVKNKDFNVNDLNRINIQNINNKDIGYNKSINDINQIYFIDEDNKGYEWNIQNKNTNETNKQCINEQSKNKQSRNSIDIIDIIDIIDFPISLDDLENTYSEIEKILKKAFENDEFVNIVVDTSFIGYIILEIAIKKFKFKNSYIFENGKFKHSHPCSCESDYMGV
ncbi:MAG: hypothetical protein LBM96_12615 [Methanobrevibacter sp.]|jgi:hypothetical protein|nr:hypothetical protein [Candidatus Methanoflexus mossambicus]